jgi:hypothetical protein
MAVFVATNNLVYEYFAAYQMINFFSELYGRGKRALSSLTVNRYRTLGGSSCCRWGILKSYRILHNWMILFFWIILLFPCEKVELWSNNEY